MPPFVYQQYRSPYTEDISTLIGRPGEIAARRAIAEGNAKANIAGTVGQTIQDLAQYRADAPRREMQTLALDAARRGGEQAKQADALTWAAQTLPQVNAQNYHPFLADAAKHGLRVDGAPAEFTPEWRDKQMRDLSLAMMPPEARAKLINPERPDYTIGDTRFEGRTNVPIATNPRPVAPPAPAAAGSFPDFVNRYATDNGKKPSELTSADLVAAKKLYDAAGRAPQTTTAGSFEDYVTRTYGDNPTPDQIIEGRKKYQQADDRPPVSLMLANQNVPGDWTKTGDDFLKTIPVQWRKTVEKLSRYEEDPTKVASMRGGMRETLMQWVNQANPAYDQDKFAIRNPTKKAFTTGTQGQQITAMNTAIEHLDQLQAAADALKNGNFKPGNAFYNSWRDTFGSAPPSNYETIKQMVDKEVEAVANKGIPTVSGTAEQKRLAGVSAGPDVIKGYIDTIMPLMGSKLHALDYQYHEAMGVDDPFRPLTPQALSILAKRGIDPARVGTGSAGATPPATTPGMIEAIDPQGQIHHAPAGTALPAGWRLK